LSLRPGTSTLRQDARHPLYLRYGAKLPSSLTRDKPDTPRASHPGAPVSDLGTDTENPSDAFFHGLQDATEFPLRGTSTVLTRFSPLWHSPSFDCTDKAAAPLGLPRSVGRRHALQHVSPWQGNVNALPFFGDTELRVVLGPANPWPKIVAKEPWPFRRRGYSPLFCCYYHRDPQPQQVHRTSQPCFYPVGAPSYPRRFRQTVCQGLGGRLEPRLSSRPHTSANELSHTP
jgi:hypothetical protein